MKNKRLLILSIVTFIVVVAAAISVNLHAPKTVIEKGLLFPALASRVNDISSIRIRGVDGTITIVKKGEAWAIEEMDGYPALFDKVRQTIISISELKVVATKTARPELYPRLGVEGPDVEGSSSVLVTLENNDGEKVASLIVGKQRRSKSAEKSPGLYVRRPEDKTSLLVEGALEITARMTDWFENTIVDIPAGSIREIITRHADGDTVHLSRTTRVQDDFDLENIPEGKKIKTTIILNRMGTVLENFHVQRAQAAGKFTFPGDAQTTTVRDFNGMGVTITSTKIEHATYARFVFDFSPGAASAEAAEGAAGIDTAGDSSTTEPTDFAAQVATLNEKLSGWVYLIPEFKYDILAKRVADLVRPDNPNQPVNVNEEMEMVTPELPAGR